MRRVTKGYAMLRLLTIACVLCALLFVGIPSVAATPVPPTMLSRSVINLPGPITSVVRGGGGRYLLFYLRQQRMCQIFDVQQKAIVKTIPIASDDAVITAGAERFFIAFRGQPMVQCWDFARLERVKTFALPAGKAVQQCGMGYASYGAIVVLMTDAHLLFYDSRTLAAIPYNTVELENKFGQPMAMEFNRSKIQATADGTFFALSCGGRSVAFSLLNGVLSTTRLVAPIQEEPSSFYGGYYKQLFPSVGGSPYTIRTRYIADAEKPWQADIISLTDSAVVIPAPMVIEELLAKRKAFDNTALDVLESAYLFPEENLLLVVPKGDQQLVLYSFDFAATLVANGMGACYVTSLPRCLAERGSQYTYQLAVVSPNGTWACHLDACPEGMTITPDGLLQWTVPADYPWSEESVIISIRDEAGKETSHAFIMQVR